MGGREAVSKMWWLAKKPKQKQNEGFVEIQIGELKRKWAKLDVLIVSMTVCAIHDVPQT